MTRTSLLRILLVLVVVLAVVLFVFGFPEQKEESMLSETGYSVVSAEVAENASTILLDLQDICIGCGGVVKNVAKETPTNFEIIRYGDTVGAIAYTNETIMLGNGVFVLPATFTTPEKEKKHVLFSVIPDELNPGGYITRDTYEIPAQQGERLGGSFTYDPETNMLRYTFGFQNGEEVAGRNYNILVDHHGNFYDK